MPLCDYAMLTCSLILFFFLPPVPGMTNLTPGLLLLLLLKSRLLGLGGFLEVTQDSVLGLASLFGHSYWEGPWDRL